MLHAPGRTAFVLCIAVLGASWAAGAAAADVVTDWGARAVALGTEKQMPNTRLSRALAMMHVAMFEAVNAIGRRYQPYRLALEADAGASPDAAAGAAAHAVLVSLFPDAKPSLDQALQATLASAPEGGARTKGVELGAAAAAGIIALRADDGSSVQESYRPYTAPGVYVPTTLPAESTGGGLKPWVMEKGSQVRPAPPPALTSEIWIRDVNEIRELGALRSAKRTVQQTEIARFWFLTGARTYTPLTRQVAEARKFDLIDSARLYALVSMATADAYIAVFDAKYTYNFWRPITAIRNADLAASAATARDPSWLPLGTTPMHPEYPCAHCIIASTVAEVLQRVAGPDIGELTLTSALPPGVTRTWKRLEDYSNEVAEARILAGFHYRFSSEAAKVMGKRIGQLAVETQLTGRSAPLTSRQ